MKKFIFTAIAMMTMFVSCNKIMVDEKRDIELPAPYVLIGVDGNLEYAQEMPFTKSNTNTENTNPVVKVAKSSSMINNTTSAYFFIRIDNRIPNHVAGDIGHQYYPQTSARKSKFDNKNKGVIKLDMPYNEFPGKFDSYIYDTDGKDVSMCLITVPSIESLIEANAFPINIDTDGLKIIWYAIKDQGAKDKGWHVDGVLTFDDVDSVLDIPEIGPQIEESHEDWIEGFVYDGQVEVDVHQQSHKDWDETKTSIHIRDDVGVHVNIPIPEAILAQKDDVAVRVFDKYYTINDNPESVTVTIEHGTSNLHINVSEITQTLLDDFMLNYGDGITIEVHTYSKDMDNKEEIWNAIQQTEVTTTKPTEVIKHTSSSLF